VEAHAPSDAAFAPTASNDAAAHASALPTLHPLLVDPRLARVQPRAADHEWGEAARALAEAEAAQHPDGRTPAERCAWAYEAGRLLLAAGDLAGAAHAFDAARGDGTDGGAPSASAPCAAYAPYATYRAADAYLRAGDLSQAAARARAVPNDSVAHDDAELVLASALAGQGRAGEAVPRWRAALGKSPKVWIDVALPLAAALLDGAEGDPDAHAAEALALVTRVIVEAPRIADTSGAEALRRRAVARLVTRDPHTPRELTFAQRVQQARVWLDAGESTKAAALAAAVLAEPTIAADVGVYCGASVVRAQALGRTKAGPGGAWDDAIARCQGDPLLATALFAGAKAAQAKLPDLARARFAKVEELFHDHRFADDARFLGALVALGQGDEPAFTRMMLTLPDDYPEGDQRGEALFRVALLRMTRGDWAGAAPVLDRIVAMTPDDRHWATAGRAAYFRARAAAELGHGDEARAGYARVLATYPLAYYMTQAYARLAESDAGEATRVLASAFAREDAAPFLSRPHPEMETSAWTRAVTLLEVGDVDLARRELAAAGAARDDVDPEVTWAVALLYDQAGAPEVGHAFARQKLRDYLAHYPVGAWRTKWEIAYPRAYSDLVLPASHESRIPSALTWAIMREESDFIADARSGSNAYGLMQLIIPTAKGVARGTGLPSDEAGLKEPRVSVALGTRLLGQLRGSFDANRVLAIAAYNGGGGAVGRWLAARPDERFDLWVEEIPWEETRGYEKRVLSSEAAYAYLYEPGTLDEVLRTPATVRGRSNVPVAPAEPGGGR
jgi:soluble lytic murein transglycosylase